MFGYIRPAADRLSKEQLELFRGAYCGLCHALGRRYGFAARFCLSYDLTFLAILIASDAAPSFCQKRCIMHPCRGGCPSMTGQPALDLAADHSVVLAWWQIQDHILDNGFFQGLKYRLAALFLYPSYRKARRNAQAFDTRVRQHLDELDRIETDGCTSLDAAAEPFAAMLSEIALVVEDGPRRRIFRQLFYHLGRWIYLIDAADDYRQDLASGNYNPIRYHYQCREPELPSEIRCALGDTLDASIRQMAAAYELLDAGIWTEVLDSIFFDSMYAIGKAVLNGGYRASPRMWCALKRKGKRDERSL